jgi:hypothetical protein
MEVKRYTPVRKRREKPRRVLGREKLYGKAKEARRRAIFERSAGFCEEMVPSGPEHYWLAPGEKVRCFTPIRWESFHWSHMRHAANKDDSMDGGIASCEKCHINRHNAGGKPCPGK